MKLEKKLNKKLGKLKGQMSAYKVIIQNLKSELKKLDREYKKTLLKVKNGGKK